MRTLLQEAWFPGGLGAGAGGGPHAAGGLGLGMGGPERGPQHRLASFGNGGCARLSFGKALSVCTPILQFLRIVSWVAHGAHPLTGEDESLAPTHCSDERVLTHPPTPRSGVMAAKPPDEVPEELKEDVAKLHKPLAAILVGKEILWAAQAALSVSRSRWKTWRIAGTPQRRLGRMVPGTWDSGMGRTGSMSRPRP